MTVNVSSSNLPAHYFHVHINRHTSPSLDRSSSKFQVERLCRHETARSRCPPHCSDRQHLHCKPSRSTIHLRTSTQITPRSPEIYVRRSCEGDLLTSSESPKGMMLFFVLPPGHPFYEYDVKQCSPAIVLVVFV